MLDTKHVSTFIEPPQFSIYSCNFKKGRGNVCQAVLLLVVPHPSACCNILMFLTMENKFYWLMLESSVYVISGIVAPSRGVTKRANEGDVPASSYTRQICTSRFSLTGYVGLMWRRLAVATASWSTFEASLEIRSREPGASLLQKLLLVHRILPEPGAILEGPGAIFQNSRNRW